MCIIHVHVILYYPYIILLLCACDEYRSGGGFAVDRGKCEDVFQSIPHHPPSQPQAAQGVSHPKNALAS